MQAFPGKKLALTVWNRWVNLQECTIIQEQEGLKWQWWWHLPFMTALRWIKMSINFVHKYTTCSKQLSYNVKHYLEYWHFLCHTTHQINVHITPLFLTAAWYILSTNIYHNIKDLQLLTVHKCTKIFWHDQPYQRWVKNQHAGGGVPLWPRGKLAQLVMSLPLDGWLNDK